MSAASVPMNPEAFYARLSRTVRIWRKKALAAVRKPGRFISRVASRLHVTQAIRWVAKSAFFVVNKAWAIAKWFALPVAAVFFTKEFIAILLALVLVATLVESYQVYRLRKTIKKEAPGSKVTLRALIQAIRDVERQVNAQVNHVNHIPTPPPEPERKPEPEVVTGEVIEEAQPEPEVVVEEAQPEPVEEVVEEVIEPVDDGVIIVEDEIHEITTVTTRHPVPTAELERETAFPTEIVDKPLPVPYRIVSDRWAELTQLYQEAEDAMDVDLLSEISGRMAVCLARSGSDVQFADEDWDKIHGRNKVEMYKREPDVNWNLTRMSLGSQKEDALLRKLANQAKAESSAG